MTLFSKTTLRLGAAVALLGGGLAPVAARADVVLTPGAGSTSIGAAETLPAGSVLEASNTRTSVGGSATNGTLTEAVYKDGTTNNLDFVFQLTSTTSSTTNITSFSTSSYGFPPSFNTNVGNFIPSPSDAAGFTAGSSPAVSPTNASRGQDGAIVIFGGFSLAPGETTTTFFVRSNASAYNSLGVATISGTVIGGNNPGSDTFMNTFEPAGTASPVGVPEPASFGMAATAGFLGLGYAWRRRKRATA